MTKLEVKKALLAKLIAGVEQLLADFVKKDRFMFDDVSDQVRDDYISHDSGLWAKEVEQEDAMADFFLQKRNMLAPVLHELRGMPMDQEADRVGPNTVVETSHGNFYVSVAFQPIEMNGKKYQPIAPDAPLYAVMKDCVKGTAFEFRGKVYKVRDVY